MSLAVIVLWLDMSCSLLLSSAYGKEAIESDISDNLRSPYKYARIGSYAFCFAAKGTTPDVLSV